MFGEQTHLYLNPVRADRAEDFERFLLDVVEPAIKAQRPDLLGRWQILTPAQPESADNGLLTYALLFDGGDLEEDWELSRLLRRHCGQDVAERLIQDWLANLVPYQPGITSMGDPETDITQPGRTFTTVDTAL